MISDVDLKIVLINYFEAKKLLISDFGPKILLITDFGVTPIETLRELWLRRIAFITSGVFGKVWRLVMPVDFAVCCWAVDKMSIQPASTSLHKYIYQRTSGQVSLTRVHRICGLRTSLEMHDCMLYKLSPCKSIRKLWPGHKHGQGQPSVIIWINLVVLEYPILIKKV